MNLLPNPLSAPRDAYCATNSSGVVDPYSDTRWFDDLSCPDFFDRLCTVALPRLRDFQGLSRRSFDGRGNFTIGLKEQLVFTEIDYDTFDKIRGMDVTIVTTARNDEEGAVLLKGLGLPLQEK